MKSIDESCLYDYEVHGKALAVISAFGWVIRILGAVLCKVRILRLLEMAFLTFENYLNLFSRGRPDRFLLKCWE